MISMLLAYSALILFIAALYNQVVTMPAALYLALFWPITAPFMLLYIGIKKHLGRV